MGSQDLIQRLKDRELDSLEALKQQYTPLLRYIIAPILEDFREREECVADVVLLVWDKIEGYDPAQGSFSTWLTVLTRNTALNRRRALERRPCSAGPVDEATPDPTPTPEETVLRKEREEVLRRAISQLGGSDRTLFYRKYYYLQSTAQIAAEMGMTQRAVEGRLHRMRKKLRALMGGVLDD